MVLPGLTACICGEMWTRLFLNTISVYRDFFIFYFFYPEAVNKDVFINSHAQVDAAVIVGEASAQHASETLEDCDFKSSHQGV